MVAVQVHGPRAQNCDLNCWSWAYFAGVSSPRHPPGVLTSQRSSREKIFLEKKKSAEISFHLQRRQTFRSLACLVPLFSISGGA